MHRPLLTALVDSSWCCQANHVGVDVVDRICPLNGPLLVAGLPVAGCLSLLVRMDSGLLFAIRLNSVRIVALLLKLWPLSSVVARKTVVVCCGTGRHPVAVKLLVARWTCCCCYWPLLLCIVAAVGVLPVARCC